MATLGCGAVGVETQRLADGSYKLTCESSLSICLRHAEELCTDYGYDVLNATEDKRRYGPQEIEKEFFDSQAVFRCRRAKPLFGGGSKPEPATQPTATPAPVTPASVQRCIPGATQACVGPGGCQGGQVCAASGMAYGECDCGSAPLPGATPAAQQPASPAGAPPASSVPPSPPASAAPPSAPKAPAPGQPAPQPPVPSQPSLPAR